MNAGDASTLRQVSLAAILGLDARVLLTTDDPAAHVVYDSIIQTTAKWWDTRTTNIARETAYEIVKAFAEVFGRKKASG